MDARARPALSVGQQVAVVQGGTARQCQLNFLTLLRHEAVATANALLGTEREPVRNGGVRIGRQALRQREHDQKRK